MTSKAHRRAAALEGGHRFNVPGAPTTRASDRNSPRERRSHTCEAARKGVREHAVKTVCEVIGTAEAGVIAFGFGYLRGRFGSEGDLSVTRCARQFRVALG